MNAGHLGLRRAVRSWARTEGWILSSSTLGAIDYGVELVSTDGSDATFAVSGFSLTTN